MMNAPAPQWMVRLLKWAEADAASVKGQVEHLPNGETEPRKSVLERIFLVVGFVMIFILIGVLAN